VWDIPILDKKSGVLIEANGIPVNQELTLPDRRVIKFPYRGDPQPATLAQR
jgi:hypothetical protein